MIDFHTHILPKIDDGAQSPEESLALLALLEKQGVDTVVLTPHYYGRNKSVKQFEVKRNAAYELLKSVYTGTIRLVKGCECNLSTCANNDLTELIPLAIEGTKYILIEMSFLSKWDEALWDKLFRLRDTTDLIPVIAHVELYPAVKRNPAYVQNLLNAGCLLQINCESVIGITQKDFVWALLSHNQVHCLGSDSHNTTSRPPLYAQAAEIIHRTFGAERIDGLQENMKKIIRGEEVKTVSSELIKKKLFKYV